MMPDRKLLNTPQVQELAARAAEHGFSRQLSKSAVERLVPDRYHIAEVVQRNRPDPVLHHRVRFLLGFTGNIHPRETWLDVADEDWAPLPSAADVIAAARSADDAR
jgi:hypothetical protein